MFEVEKYWLNFAKFFLKYLKMSDLGSTHAQLWVSKDADPVQVGSASLQDPDPDPKKSARRKIPANDR